MYALVIIFFGFIAYLFLYLLLCVLKNHYKKEKTSFIGFCNLPIIIVLILLVPLWIVSFPLMLLYPYLVLFLQRKENMSFKRPLLYALPAIVLSIVLFFIYICRAYHNDIDVYFMTMLGIIDFIIPFVYFKKTKGDVRDAELLLWLSLATLLPVLLIISGMFVVMGS